MSDTTSEPTTEPVLERVARRIHEREKRHEPRVEWKSMPEEHREMYRDDARAILQTVADAVEEEAIVRWEDYGAPDERDAEWHSVAGWIREQAAEEGARDVED